jgi:hypothetical protein
MLPTALGASFARGTLSFDHALERFCQLAFHYRSAGEALQVVTQTGNRVSDAALWDAHLLANAAPMAERSGVLYGHIRMLEQGWQRVAEFKLPGNHGLDAAYVRVNSEGVRERAILEAKSGRASARSLGEAGGFQQGTRGYIANRLNALVALGESSKPTLDLARELLFANREGTVKSFVSFADQGRAGARLLELPGTRITTIRGLPAVPWRISRGGI